MRINVLITCFSSSMSLMPWKTVTYQLSTSQKTRLLTLLESIGIQHLEPSMRQSLLYPLSDGLLKDKEFLSRYFLLTAALDQQAESESARKTVIQIYSRYGADFFMNPDKYADKLHPILSLVKQHYKPKVRVLRLTANGASLLRVGGFLLTLINVEQEYGGLIQFFSHSESPSNLLTLIENDPLIGGLLYEKAARMYTGWISHPNLWINISNGEWKVSDIPMVVDGHVCKVLARAGFLTRVSVEDLRKYVVKAREERENIEREVSRILPNGDRFMIDFGAFYIGLNYCHEEQPKCDSCPIKEICRKNRMFRAY